MYKKEINNMDEYPPLVSICVVTYNQECYIKECIDSLINQSFKLPYEIIISDDCSTDKTIDILYEFEKKHPNLITVISQKKNIGAAKNIFSAYKKAKGKYIAHMDGDDFAYTNKIENQVLALETNPDCIICSHDVCIIDRKGEKLKDSFYTLNSGVYNKLDLLHRLPFFAHSSKMFRNIFNDIFWNQFDDKTLDIEVHISQLDNGNIIHLNETLGAYRYLTGMSVKNGQVNPHIVAGNNRIFENILAQGIYDERKVKKLHAQSLFSFAYQSAILGNKSDLKQYIITSASIKIISLSQLLLLFTTLIPSLAVKLCKLRSKLKGYG